MPVSGSAFKLFSRIKNTSLYVLTPQQTFYRGTARKKRKKSDMFDLPGVIVYNNSMNDERLQVLDLHRWIKQLRKKRDEEFFRDFDTFLMTLLRLIALFFGVDLEQEDVSHSNNPFSHQETTSLSCVRPVLFPETFRTIPFSRCVLSFCL